MDLKQALLMSYNPAIIRFLAAMHVALASASRKPKVRTHATPEI